MILMIDNYDSFTYNLYQQIGHFEKDIQIFRNDAITIAEIESLAPQQIIISPGPKYPKDAGISMAVIQHFSGKLPILGVCLGHQSIGEVFGSQVVRAKHILHGKVSEITLDETCPLFKNLPHRVKVGRYHSLIVERESLGEELIVTAADDEGEIMGIRHRKAPTFGLQFHPESILTECGHEVIKNFLEV